MWVETFAVPPLGCNCTVLGDETTREALVIDPGGDAPGILKRLEAKGFRATALLHTHTHIDHVGATSAVQRAHNARARIHEGDLFLYEMLAVQGQLLGMRAPHQAELDAWLTDGETVTAGGIKLEVIHTPGHTPGSVCFRTRGDDGRDLLFAGDTLFHGSIGRTDLWGGDAGLILKSIQQRLLSLDDETLVITGHDRATTIGRERLSNPFLR
ncbi:MAG: MBL fold metallo-hydrolase [Myxococcales bacterium]|nr:MBL fold metallo-hydrolase [Myxococcales bacterium]